MKTPTQLPTDKKGANHGHKPKSFIDFSFGRTLALVFLAFVIFLTTIALKEIERDTREDIAASLQTVLNTTVEATRLWVEKREHNSNAWASSPTLLKFTKELLRTSRDRKTLLASPALIKARKHFEPILQNFNDLGFFIISPDYINIASLRDGNVGEKNLIAIQKKELLDKAFEGRFTLIPPIISDVPLADSSGKLVEDYPTMFVVSPIQDENGSTIAVLTFRVDPSKGFSSIAKFGRIGATGETYYFDRTGTLISESRFDDNLRDIGLIKQEQRGILSVEIRDPGVNLLEGHFPENLRHEQPLTLMAKSAIAGESGVNMDGYRDYRGVRVLGAWHWDDQFGIGVTTEIDEAEALDSFYNLRAIIIFIVFIAAGLVAALFIFLAWFLKQRKKTTWEKEENLKSLPLKLKRYAWTLLAGWTIILVIMLALELRHASHHTHEMAKEAARVHFEWIKLFRSWVNSHGGVYVPTDERTPPNEYLAQVAERDITTPSGKKLTLVNPAYMTRQIFEGFVTQVNIEGHLTSLNPLRPANAPDEWEKKALEAFERGEHEREEVATINGLPHLRLMRPLYVKDACLKCHAHQGYETGDVYGGISVSASLAGYQASRRGEVISRSLGYGLLWILGIAAIGFGERGLRRQIHERKAAEEALHEKARIIDMVNDSVVSTDLDGYVTSWNKGAERLFGYTAEEMMGKHISSLYPEDEHEFLQSQIIAPLMEEGTHETEVRMRKKSGEDFYGLLSLSMTWDENGDATGMVGTTIDNTERKKAREALSQFKTTLDQTLDCVFMFESVSLKFFYVNQGALDQIGYSMEELYEMTPVDIKPEFNETQFNEAIAPLLDGSKPSLRFETVHEHKNGKLIPVEIFLQHIVSSNETSRFVAIVQDITERKRVEKALRENEERVRLLLDHTAEAIYGVDINENCTFVNPSCLKILGYDNSGEMFGKNIHELIHYKHPDGSDYAMEECRIHKAYREGKGVHVDDEVFWRSDGTSFPVEYWSHPIRRDGEVLGAVITFFDITERKRNAEELRKAHDGLEDRVKEATSELMAANEYLRIEATDRKRAEEELREAHAEAEQMLKAIPSFFIGLNTQNRVTKWNKVAEITFGKKSTEVMGKPFEECGIDWNRDEIAKRIETCKQSGQLENINDFPYGKPGGKDGFLSISFTSVSMESDKQRMLLMSGFDITERKILEAQLGQAQKLESIGQLAAGIAHEINTPTQFVGDNVRFIQGALGDINTLLDKNSELLAAYKTQTPSDYLIREVKSIMEDIDIEYLREEVPKAIQASLRGIERVATIVRAMKEFSHPGAKEKTPIDINKAIESTITVAKNEWKYVAEMETDFDRSLPYVPCLPGDFNQVILNLVTNAAHAIGEVIGDSSNGKGKISVRTCQKDGFAEISISDTGGGVPEEARDKIFDPFFTTKEVGKGTGQGLAISRSVIVDKHGGTINVETEKGKGATFIIRLPIKEEIDNE